MKLSRIISSGLASGALRMRPEVMGVIKKLSGCEEGGATEPTPENCNPEATAPEAPPASSPMPPNRSQRLMSAVRSTAASRAPEAGLLAAPGCLRFQLCHEPKVA